MYILYTYYAHFLYISSYQLFDYTRKRRSEALTQGSIPLA